MSTTEARGKVLAGVGLIMAGSPIIGFQMPTDKMRNEGIGSMMMVSNRRAADVLARNLRT